jgi:hypothetical protein
MRTLTDVRRDLVQTIRQVVDVVSKYAGGASPEPAFTRIRGFIWKLPRRWASKTVVSVLSSGLAVNGGPEPAGNSERERERKKDRKQEWDSVTAASRSRGLRSIEKGVPDQIQEFPAGHRHLLLRGCQGTCMAALRLTLLNRTVIVTMGRPETKTENLDITRGVTGVIRDSLDRVDGYVVVFSFSPPFSQSLTIWTPFTCRRRLFQLYSLV